jgi:amidohydrolase
MMDVERHMPSEAEASIKDRIEESIRSAQSELIEISHRIHDHPELAFEERFASQLLADWLEAKGLEVEREAYGLETSFAAGAGRGDLKFVLCAEYDALPDIGHACGHNVIAAIAAGAGLGAAVVSGDLAFRVEVLGTPAEETAGGKAILIERGAFEGVAAALMVHPAPVDILDAPFLAVTDLVITATGKAAHASLQTGEGGRNALDAIVEVYSVLRDLELGPYERCNGVITEGGKAPNVVPEMATAAYYIRARTRSELETLLGKVRAAAEAAVAPTNCSVEFSGTGMIIDDVSANKVILEIYRSNAERLGRRFLRQDLITPQMAASTDMGNVSKIVPSIHPTIGIDSLPHLPHQRGFADAARSPGADLAVIEGAISLAWTIADLAANPSAIEAARKEFDSEARLRT